MTPFLSTKPGDSWLWRGWGHFRATFVVASHSGKKQKKTQMVDGTPAKVPEWDDQHVTLFSKHHDGHPDALLVQSKVSSPDFIFLETYKKGEKIGWEDFHLKLSTKKYHLKKILPPRVHVCIKEAVFKALVQNKIRNPTVEVASILKKKSGIWTRQYSVNLCVEGAQNDHRDPSQVYLPYWWWPQATNVPPPCPFSKDVLHLLVCGWILWGEAPWQKNKHSTEKMNK